MIKRLYRKFARKLYNAKIWRKYGNKTKYHFWDCTNIFVDGDETYGVPRVECYDDTAKLRIVVLQEIVRLFWEVIIMSSGLLLMHFIKSLNSFLLGKK